MPSIPVLGRARSSYTYTYTGSEGINPGTSHFLKHPPVTKINKLESYFIKYFIRFHIILIDSRP